MYWHALSLRCLTPPSSRLIHFCILSFKSCILQHNCMHRINSVSQQVMKIRLLSETRCIYIATLYQVMDLVGSDPNPNTSASGHFNSPDIDFNVQLSDDTMHTAYPEDILNLLPPSQGPSLYWGWSDSDSQCSSLVPDSEINIEEQLLINTPDLLYNVYMAKVLLVTIGTQQCWQLLCPDCQEWVQTSVSSQLPLWYPGQFSSLSSHWGSCKCMKSLNEKTIWTMPNVPLSCSLSLTSEHR
jgi:hypothetical protein